MYFVVSYDIKNDKRRDKIAELLNFYGIRVNYSVYEIKIEKKDLRKLIFEILKIVNKKEDSVRFYNISKNDILKSFEICNYLDILDF
ncbi:CRISPR-associated endonuclease Cas2 [Caminibacter pacificus]|uniref:CRISPR-associated endoribonuclease Cas2 n=1 Tax=Caminibacter pacificus TaxID=1424653 RepID=A0AAJ4UX33_9BACT|nr:CRISPR-associated endonuclease Cas2 [Caminibacter pacificus]QCI28741.1 CRISPR-associated endonuclease Cas2 [Caminibacter pacificus]ROR37194.1 CRISPR-associated protein Cas2 [Caminibacter pacificus]